MESADDYNQKVIILIEEVIIQLQQFEINIDREKLNFESLDELFTYYGTDKDKKVKTIAGKFQGAEGPIKNHNVEPIYFDVDLNKGKEFSFNIPITHNSFIYLVHGEIKVGNKNHDKTSGSNLILLSKGEKLTIKATLDSKFLLISGKPINEDKFVHINWQSKKGNSSYKILEVPYVTRKERKGKL